MRLAHNSGKTKSDYDPLATVSVKMMGNKNAAGRFGKLNGMYGKKAPATIESNKRRSGEKRSESCKKKIGSAVKAAWANKSKRKKWISSMRKVWCKHLSKTYLEKKFEALCKKHNLPFRYVGNGKLWITACGIHMNPDFVDTKGMRIVVEVYARCWKSKSYARVRGQLLKAARFRAIFLNDVIMDSEAWEAKCLNKIRLQIRS